MTVTFLIAICLLLLLAYVFDISSKFTSIPSVILLLILGWVIRQSAELFKIYIPDLNPLLAIFGVVGLVLIVLEGSLELELNKSKFPLIKKASFISILPLISMSLLLSWVFQYFSGVSYKIGLINAIPFCIISSAIAIPSVRNLSESSKEFIIYESSFSDVFGVLFFNFIALNEYINAESLGTFGLQILLIIIISFVSVLGLSYLLGRITHHITYTPMILLVVLIYAISKQFHLPALIFIMVFGLFLGNLDELKHYKWIEKFRHQNFDKEVAKFKDITIEATFLIRALFFLLFGFLMNAKEILNTETLPWAIGIVAGVIIIRWLFMLVTKMSMSSLIYVAPRGLITILLFIAITPEQLIPIVNRSLIIQTIIISVVVMMLGLMIGDKTHKLVFYDNE